ncbi:MAG: hypothetical protein LAT68_07330 [Cyclobacteriaceae bacterium]|nr:hypothetical protein [Cyclobacteriaceae bacterium]MCH8516127.1 hypothetical protein [Cyclobacteriaceae bacterium]
MKLRFKPFLFVLVLIFSTINFMACSSSDDDIDPIDNTKDGEQNEGALLNFESVELGAQETGIDLSIDLETGETYAIDQMSENRDLIDLGFYWTGNRGLLMSYPSDLMIRMNITAVSGWSNNVTKFIRSEISEATFENISSADELAQLAKDALVEELPERLSNINTSRGRVFAYQTDENRRNGTYGLFILRSVVGGSEPTAIITIDLKIASN